MTLAQLVGRYGKEYTCYTKSKNKMPKTPKITWVGDDDRMREIMKIAKENANRGR